jgi:hypothetical protein
MRPAKQRPRNSYYQASSGHATCQARCEEFALAGTLSGQRNIEHRSGRRTRLACRLTPSQRSPLFSCKCSDSQEKAPARNFVIRLDALPSQYARLVRDDQIVRVVPFLM